MIHLKCIFITANQESKDLSIYSLGGLGLSQCTFMDGLSISLISFIYDLKIDHITSELPHVKFLFRWRSVYLNILYFLLDFFSSYLHTRGIKTYPRSYFLWKMSIHDDSRAIQTLLTKRPSQKIKDQSFLNEEVMFTPLFDLVWGEAQHGPVWLGMWHT